LRQSLPLLVALAISLNINSCTCKDKGQSSSSSDNEDPKNEVTNPITLALTSGNGSQLIGDTPLVLIIKNTGKQPIIPKNLKLKILRGGTLKPCVEHEVLLSKQMLVGGQITETISIIPGMSKQITFTCQIIHQVGGQEKLVGEPLIVEWKSNEPLLKCDIAYDKNTGDMLCTIIKESTEPIKGIVLHCKGKTSGVKFNGQLLHEEQLIVIGDLQAGANSINKKIGNFDLGNNQYAEFDCWLSYTGGSSECAKKSVVFTAADVCLEISESYYDLEKNSIIYDIQNRGQDIAQDIKLHYRNISRDDVGSTVLVGNGKEGTINLGNISGGSSMGGELAVEMKSANKFKMALEVIYKDIVLHSLCIEVVLPKLKLVPTTSDFLVGINQNIQFKIEEENNIPIDLSNLSILVKPDNENIKIIHQGNEIKKVLLGASLGCIGNPVHLTIEPGKATKTSIGIQLVYCGNVVAEKSFTWQDDVSQATKEMFEAVNKGDVTKINELLSEREVQLNATDEEGEGLLWKATLNGNKEAVLALLNAPDIDINTRNNDSKSNLYGYNLLQWYVQQSDIAMVAELLNKGAKINDEMDDQMGYSPLHLAISNRDLKMLDLLLQVPSIQPNTPDKSGTSPLHLAICTGNQEAIDRLLAKGADVNAVDNFGRTPLHMLVTYKGNQETIDKLLKKGADVSAVDNFGRTPLAIAIQKGDTATIKQLISTSTKPSMKGEVNLSVSCLHDIVEQGHSAFIEQLISSVGVNIQDGCGNTFLHYAVKQGDETIARLLIEKGADLDLQNKQQESSKDWFGLYCPCK